MIIRLTQLAQRGKHICLAGFWLTSLSIAWGQSVSYDSSMDGTWPRNASTEVNPALPSSTPNSPSSVTLTSPSYAEEPETSISPSDGKNVFAPPVKPNEFQRFVESSTGKRLPIFGANFFTSTSQLDTKNLAVTDDYVIGVGDEIVLRTWAGVDSDLRLIVDKNGQIAVPKAGTLTVAGLKASDLKSRLRTHLGRYFNNFELDASVGKIKGITVFAVGQAARPGSYQLTNQSSLLSAVLASGGPGANGSMRHIKIRRDGKIIAEFDLYDFLIQGDKSKDVRLANGDALVFEPAGPRVAILGAIDNAAVYELKSKNESLKDILTYAGGTSVLINPNRLQLERIDPSHPDAPRTVQSIMLSDAGRQTLLRDGDILTLIPMSPKFSNAVTLKGNVAQPLRYPFRPGMRLRDLIPDREALLTPDYYRRKNLLVQVEPLSLEDVAELRRYRNALEASALASTGSQAVSSKAPLPSTSFRDRRESQLDFDLKRVTEAKRSPGTLLMDEVNWDYAMIERVDPSDLSLKIIPFSPRSVLIGTKEEDNLELQAGDVVTIFSQKDVKVPSSQQTRLVTVEGEVVGAGVYRLEAGETLRQLIRRAGGLTAQSYVYGTEFSREETRRKQQLNLMTAIQRLETMGAAQVARIAANRSAADLQAASVQAMQAATDAQIKRLKTLQPNGRIALEISPSAKTLEALPDIPLENGDRILIPSRPGFVTVAGSVINPNAFLWKPERTVDQYLKLAGLDETADVSQMFILRADGTVVNSADRRGFLGMGGLAQDHLYPGDTLIVPGVFDYETWGSALVRNLKDWTQILSQFGLGAAAIITLRNN